MFKLKKNKIIKVVDIDAITTWSVAFVVRTMNRLLQPIYYGCLMGMDMKYIF